MTASPSLSRPERTTPRRDRLDPDLTAPYLPPDPDHVDVAVVIVPMLKEHFELIKRLTKQVGETSPEMMAARIITTWVRDNRPD